MRTSTFVMIGFAVLFGALAVFLAQIWLNNQAELRMRSLEAHKKAEPPAHTIVVASQPLRFGDDVSARALREVPWPSDALPAGAFSKISELTADKRVVVMPIEVNEAVLATKITGPGQRATLSATLQNEMKAVTIRVNDVEGVAGFVLPGDHVDVVMSRSDQNVSTNDVVIQNARVLAIDQLADERADKPSVAKAVTLEVDVASGQKLALASTVGTLSLMLRKAGELAETMSRRVTLADLGHAADPVRDLHFITVGVTRASKRQDYSVPVENDRASSYTLSGATAHD
ncbi:MAG: Flp pilus assembly protein CpaB [Xanthobacteraceae bacterium]